MGMESMLAGGRNAVATDGNALQLVKQELPRKVEALIARVGSFSLKRTGGTDDECEVGSISTEILVERSPFSLVS